MTDLKEKTKRPSKKTAIKMLSGLRNACHFSLQVIRDDTNPLLGRAKSARIIEECSNLHLTHPKEGEEDQSALILLKKLPDSKMTTLMLLLKVRIEHVEIIDEDSDSHVDNKDDDMRVEDSGQPLN